MRNFDFTYNLLVKSTKFTTASFSQFLISSHVKLKVHDISPFFSYHIKACPVICYKLDSVQSSRLSFKTFKLS